MMDNLTYRGKQGICPYEKFYKKRPLEIKYLRRIGEVGVLCNRKKIKSKDEERGTKGIFVGYADDHTPDTYRMYNPITRKIVLSRDIRWLDTFYLGDEEEEKIKIIEYEDDVIEEAEDNKNENQVMTPGNQGISERVPERPVTRSS